MPSRRHLLKRFRAKYAAGAGEIAPAEVMDGVKYLVIVANRPVALREDPVVGRRGHDFGEAGVIGLLRMRLSDQAAFEPGCTTRLDHRHAKQA